MTPTLRPDRACTATGYPDKAAARAAANRKRRHRPNTRFDVWQSPITGRWYFTAGKRRKPRTYDDLARSAA